MPYVTFAERYAMEKGEEKGLHKAVEAILKVRYPESISSLMPMVRRVEGSDALEQMIQLATESSLDELRTAIEAAQPASK
jgi:predicted ArsR family transcriptional regulator